MSTITNLAAPATTANSAADNARESLGADYQSFLKLLTAQVANQDPLAPMDSTTFVTQLAQLSQVEQTIATNTNLENIASKLASAGAMADLQLIGREVTVPSDKIHLEAGQGRYAYELDDTAGKVSAEILAEDGTVVRRLAGLGSTAETRHEIAWDGLDEDGLPVPDGSFTVKLIATDAEGEGVGYAGFARASVERVNLDPEGAMLVLADGSTVASREVTEVR